MKHDARVFQAYLAGLLDSLPDASLLVNASGEIVLVNSLLEQMFGYERGELLNRPIQALIPERYRPAHAGHFASYFARPRRGTMGGGLTLHGRRRDGSEFPVEIRLGPLPTDAGVLVLAGIRAISEDEQRYREIFEEVPVGVLHTDARGRILSANRRFCDMSGYARDEALSLNVFRLIHPGDQAKAMEAGSRMLGAAGAPHEADMRLLRKDGTPMRTHVTTSLVRTHDGRPLHFVSVIQDITEIHRAMESTIEVMATMSAMRDPYTHGHGERVAAIATNIAVHLGLATDAIEGIRVAGYLHDVGKIAVPAEILSKPTRLSKPEFELVAQHAEQGYEILKNVEFPWPIAEAAWQHHERLDGSGYPRGLRGDEIILEARIVAVADTIEAIAAHRPYRPGAGIHAALDEVRAHRDTLYDATVVDAGMRLFEAGFRLPD